MVFLDSIGLGIVGFVGILAELARFTDLGTRTGRPGSRGRSGSGDRWDGGAIGHPAAVETVGDADRQADRRDRIAAEVARVEITTSLRSRPAS